MSPLPGGGEAPAERPIRDAASVIAVRPPAAGSAEGPRVLMGRRGKAAAFMPAKVVFPGGGVDPCDREAAAVLCPPRPLADCLGRDRADIAPADPALGAALVLTALREMWEETGVAPVAAGPAPEGELPPVWSAYVAARGCPPLDAFDYIFRAVTPPGRSRRFDARFLMIDARRLADPDDFSGADGELSDLGWRTIPEALSEDLPFVTALVLAEVAARTGTVLTGDAAHPAPFFRHLPDRSVIDPA